MSFLSELLKESASAGASSAGGVANNRGTLFGGGKGKNGGTNIMLRRMGFVEVSELASLKKQKPVKKLFQTIKEADNSAAAVKPFDYQETLAKLDQAVKTAGERKDNVAVFGLEDDEGKIVKVYIDKDQADNFEEALGQLLADNDTTFADEDEPKTETEIAEILYKLKDQFDIRDVVWGTIHGDEEEEFDVEGEGDLDAEGEGMEGEGELGDEEGLEGEDELGAEGGEMGADPTEDNATSALQSVIQMMQADSDARKAEALARQSEAEAVIAKNAALAAQAQVEKEEDLLDMQTAEKAEKAAKKEAETLARLAKYKREVGDADVELDPSEDEDDFAAGAGADEMGDEMDMGGEEDFDFEGEENEEKIVVAKERPQREITKEQLAKLILKYARANG